MKSRHVGLAIGIAASITLCGFAQGAAKDTPAKPERPATAAAAKDRPTLEKEFARKLTGAALVGTFSIDGQPTEKPAHPERYELESVSKLAGNQWVFVSRIRYGSNDVKVPLTLTVLWAGDTPMISLTDLTIPGMGTFTARVMFHGDRYAGTWQHGKVGGHMWGRIEPAKPAKDSTPEKPPAKP